jgi:hypothetical protein
MILRVLKGTRPGVILLTVIIILAVWVSAFIKLPPGSLYQHGSDYMPLYRLLVFLTGSNPLIGTSFSFLLVCILAFLLVNFNTNVYFINERTLLPAAIYALLTGIFPQNQCLNPVIPASVFLMAAIIKIMEGYHKPGIAYNFFDAGILISTGSLFYVNLIWFGLLVLVGIILLRTGNLTEFLISLLGLITPYLITFGIYYSLGENLQSLLLLIKNNLLGRSEGFIFTRIYTVVLLITGLIALVSIIYLYLEIDKKKIKSRKTFHLLAFALLISLGTYFLIPSVSVEMVWLLSIPVSYFMTHYFLFTRGRTVPDVFFSIFLLAVMLVQVLHIINV